MCLADVVQFHICFNPPSLVSCNYLTPVTLCVSLPQLMASLCHHSLHFWNERRAAVCLNATLLLLVIKCCFLIKM